MEKCPQNNIIFMSFLNGIWSIWWIGYNMSIPYHTPYQPSGWYGCGCRVLLWGMIWKLTFYNISWHILKKTLRMHSKREKSSNRSYNLIFWMTADVQYIFHDQIDCLHYPHLDWNFAPFFADDGWFGSWCLIQRSTIFQLSWRSVLLVEESEDWKNWSHNVVSSTFRHERSSNSQL